MLKLYNYLDNAIEQRHNQQWHFEAKLNYFACDIMETLDIEDAAEIATSLNRAFQACGSLNIPFSSNFKRVYRFNGKELIADWKISSLACYLIIINCNPCHESVAKAQLFFAMNKTTNK